jgi:hypothetical protein
MWGLPDLIR